MPNFNNGTVTSVTLDEYDTLSVSGTARLQVTVGSKPQFETTSVGDLTFGPFGFITYITINATGLGSYSQQPSNNPIPVAMVDVSPAQLAAPTSTQLAITNVLYQRNAPPYDIYQSNGTAFVPLGGVGSVQAGALVASTTVAPNATAVQSAIAAAVGTGAIRVAATLSIPLDTAGNGKAMPLVAGQMIPLTADVTPAISAGSVLSGVCVADYVSSGTGNLNLSAYFLTRGDTYAAEAARLFTVTYFMQTSGAYAIVQKGALSATFPFFTAQSAPAGTVGTTYSYTYVAPNATSFALFSGALPAGNALNTATGNVGGTPTTPATSTYMLLASGPGGTSLSTAQSVVIAAATTAPGQVTGLTFGTPTSTTQPLTWAAPVSNGGSAITDYLIEYKATISGTWLTFSHTASISTSATLAGLTASTSYDARVSAISAIGTGTASSVVTGVTTAVGTLSYVTYVQSSENVTAAGYLDYVVFTGTGAGAIGTVVKNGVGLIGTLSGVNLTTSAGSMTSVISGTDGLPTATFSITNNIKGILTTSTSLGYFEISLPAGIAVRHARCSISNYNANSAISPILRAHLSDSSALDLAVAIPSVVGFANTETGFNISYNSAVAGQTLRLRFEMPPNADATVFQQIQVVTYQ